MERFYTVYETAEALHVTPRTMYEWLRTGRFVASRAGARWLITEGDIKAFLTRGTQPPPPIEEPKKLDVAPLRPPSSGVSQNPLHNQKKKNRR